MGLREEKVCLTAKGLEPLRCGQVQRMGEWRGKRDLAWLRQNWPQCYSGGMEELADLDLGTITLKAWRVRVETEEGDLGSFWGAVQCLVLQDHILASLLFFTERIAGSHSSIERCHLEGLAQ